MLKCFAACDISSDKYAFRTVGDFKHAFSFRRVYLFVSQLEFNISVYHYRVGKRQYAV